MLVINKVVLPSALAVLLLYVPANTYTYEAPPLEEEVDAVTEEQELTVQQVTYPVGCQEYLPLVERYDWDSDIVLRIMRAESGCVPYALNNNPNTRDYSVGLMQINVYGDLAKNRPSPEELFIPENNIAYAYSLYQSGGYGHWSVCSNGMVYCN